MAIITISQRDSAGTLYPYGENRVRFHYPAGVIVRSAENGNPVDTETNHAASSRRTFFGLLRVFAQASGDQRDLWFMAGTICGDKALTLSDMVAIDVQQVVLRGRELKRDIKIYYTTDGSEPAGAARLYTAPFAVVPGTTVKAVVCDGAQRLFAMQESFGEGEGLYWGGADIVRRQPDNRLQAERGRLLRGAAAEKQDGVSFVRLARGGALELYQENDGGSREVALTVVCRSEHSISVWNNGEFVALLPPFSSKTWEGRPTKITLLGGANTVRLEADGTTDVDCIVIKD
jgi:beta-galactosidase